MEYIVLLLAGFLLGYFSDEIYKIFKKKKLYVKKRVQVSDDVFAMYQEQQNSIKNKEPKAKEEVVKSSSRKVEIITDF